MQTVTIQSICERWRSADRPLFKRALISDDGCCCAQGDVLRASGWSDDRIRNADQVKADREVATKLGISRAHSILLRHVNDSADGCPQHVLEHPEKIIGDQAPRVLAFWHKLDEMMIEDWWKVFAAWDAATDVAWDAAGDAASSAATDAAGDAARDAAGAAAGYAATDAAGNAVHGAAWDAAWATAHGAAWAVAQGVAWDAAWATGEIQGAEVMRARNQSFLFLPLFGVNDPAELDA